MIICSCLRITEEEYELMRLYQGKAAADALLGQECGGCSHD